MKLISIAALTFIALILFIASCVITLSDGQGAIVFIFSIPLIFILLTTALVLGRRLPTDTKKNLFIKYLPKISATLIIFFFVSAFVSPLRPISDFFMSGVANVFASVTGETPYVFFKNRASFENKLKAELKEKNQIDFSQLNVTFAWDKVCIFGPYTNNAQARSLLKLEWDIEQHSQIHQSDSINALVFLYQDKVNVVVNLNRSLVDFKSLDLCINRDTTKFSVSFDADGRKYLDLIIP